MNANKPHRASAGIMVRRNRSAAAHTLGVPEVYQNLLRAASPPRLCRWAATHAPALLAAIARHVVGPRVVAPIFDAEGRRYTAIYRVLPVALDGSGPVMPSHRPETLAAIPAYPHVFQARDLAEFAEREKIRQIAQALDPHKLLVPHSDATLGAPVVWEDARMYPVLAGNGRTVAFLTACARGGVESAAYRAYVDAAQDIWPTLAPVLQRAVPAGFIQMIVRVLRAADGAALPAASAVQFAGASQGSTAAEESPFGKALSAMRSIGLTNVLELPAFAWNGPINQDTIGAFTRKNRAFWSALLERIAPTRRAGFENRAETAAELVSQVLVTAIPPEVLRVGLDDRKEQAALMGALPAIMTLHSGVRRGEVKAAWDLYPQLGAAFSAARVLSRRRLSLDGAISAWESEQRQTGIEGTESSLARIDPLGLVFALALKKAAGRADPAQAMTEYLAPYMSAALDDRPEQASFFGGIGGVGPSPVATLAAAVDQRLVRLARRNAGHGDITAPLSDESWYMLTRLAQGAAVPLAYGPSGIVSKTAADLVQLKLARFTSNRYGDGGLLQSTPAGIRAVNMRNAAREATARRLQGALFPS